MSEQPAQADDTPPEKPKWPRIAAAIAGLIAFGTIMAAVKDISEGSSKIKEGVTSLFELFAPKDT